jgi:hypothetical protein
MLELDALFTTLSLVLSLSTSNTATCEKRKEIVFTCALSYTNQISTMAPNTRARKEVEEAALILLRMADQSWDSPHPAEDVETETEEVEYDASESADERMESAEILLSISQAAVVHSVAPSQSVPAPAALAAPAGRAASATTSAAPVDVSAESAAPDASATLDASATPDASTTSDTSTTPDVPASTPTSTPTSTSSATNASMATLTVEQRTLQQQRLAMTSRQRAALHLKSYAHYDFNNIQIGTLWQTKNENRTFRQTQRRRGAARLRAGTTTGLKFPRRRA